MAKNKPNRVALTGQVRLPEDLDRAVDMEASKLGLYKYEVIDAAWKAYIATTGHAERSTTADPSTLSAKKSVHDSTVSPQQRIEWGLELVALQELAADIGVRVHKLLDQVRSRGVDVESQRDTDPAKFAGEFDAARLASDAVETAERAIRDTSRALADRGPNRPSRKKAG